MSVTAQSIVYEAQRALNDLAGVRMPASDLVRLLNRAQRDIHVVRPDTTVLIGGILCSAGYRQVIPEEVAQLIDIFALAEGSKRAISKVDQSLLDATDPTWRSKAETAEVRHYMHDVRRDNRTFYVYPPALENTALAAKYSAYPLDVPEPSAPGAAWSTVTGNISLGDEWSTVLLMLTLSYAYMTDLEGVGNAALAQAHMQQASAILGVDIQAKTAIAPQEKD